MAIMKKETVKVSEDVEKGKPLHTIGRNVN